MNCCMFDRAVGRCRVLTVNLCERRGAGKCPFHKTAMEAREAAYKSLARRQALGSPPTDFDKRLLAGK